MAEIATDLTKDPAFASWPPDAATVRCPYDYFARLRSAAPVYRFPAPDPEGAPMFIVTGHAQACSVLMQPKLFINNLRHDDGAPEPKPRPDIPTLHKEPNIFFTDGDDHGVKRSWALKFVERAKLGGYADLIRQECGRPRGRI